MSPNPPASPRWTCPCGSTNDDWRTRCRNCQTARPSGSSIEPFTFPETGQPVRVVQCDGEPWFVAGDVALILGYRESYHLTRGLEEDEKGPHNLGTPGGDQEVSIISEPGLYSAILRSRVPAARAFKRWVTHEVLPAIRRTGGYAAPQQIPSHAESLRGWAAEVERREAAEARAAELEPAAQAWDTLADASGDYALREAAQVLDRDPAISTGQKRLARTLRDLGWCGEDGQPYQRHVDAGRLVRRALTYPHPHTGVDQATTQLRITAKGLEELRRHLGGGAQLQIIEGGAA